MLRFPALFQDYGYLVFESDRHQAIVPETSSFTLCLTTARRL